ncbi:hypothetical protein DFS33DRAFT_1326575 [Desarmillaria ectypa]|nr:hypothetical protein DFS33DRAFT_1326575 [Desarmillaria ectypa]
MDVQVSDTVLPERSSEVWFADGNIIIQTESTQFRVYRGILAANSPVLSDMLSLSQPDENDMVGDCPVVHFHDFPKDMVHFLKALHFPRYFQPLETTTSYFLPRRKYEVEHLFEPAFKHLSTLFPSTLSGWISRTYEGIENFNGLPLAVYQLAKETQCLTLLPASMYTMIITMKVGRVLNGVTLPDGSRVEISQTDKILWCQMRSHFLTLQRTKILRFLFEDIPGCQSQCLCNNHKYGIIRDLSKVTRAFDFPGSGLFDLPLVWERVKAGLCMSCGDAAFKQWTTAREKMWENLPVMLKLSSWQDLHKSSA